MIRLLFSDTFWHGWDALWYISTKYTLPIRIRAASTEIILIWPLYEDWRRQWHPTPVLLPGKSHGWRSLVGCRPWGRKESDTTERLPFHFSLSCIGEGNGNPLQCSCLENPRDGGAWWAAVYGVQQSRTRLKRLSSSSIWRLGLKHPPLCYKSCPPNSCGIFLFSI